MSLLFAHVLSYPFFIEEEHEIMLAAELTERAIRGFFSCFTVVVFSLVLVAVSYRQLSLFISNFSINVQILAVECQLVS